MANAQELIGRVTLSSAQSAISFTNLPQNYRDLVLVIQGTQSVNTTVYLNYNGDSGSNYLWTRMYGDGANAACSSSNSTTFSYPGDVGPGQSSMIVSINDYSQTDKHKTLLSRANMPANYVFLATARWASTAAINSINITGSSAYASGFTFAIYGVLG